MANVVDLLKYRISFLQDTFKISTNTFDYHADHRFPKNERPIMDVWKVSYDGEILTMAIKIYDEPERRVYFKVSEKELLVGCTANTSRNHISRYAYYVLLRMASIDNYVNFEKYYWPDFFDNNGETNYLDILNFRGKLDIYLKEEYIYFFKPGQHLEYPIFERKFRRPCAYLVNREVVDFQIKSGVGFCLFYCHNTHSTHLPILLPYLGTIAKTKRAIKSFDQFITDEINPDDLNFSAVQKSIYETCRDMLDVAGILPMLYNSEKEARIVVENTNKRRYSKMLGLWHILLASLVLQPYTHHAVGIWNIRRKMQKNSMPPIKFGLNTPKICFLWNDKGEYFELSYRFKINDEVVEPAKFIQPYFISSTKDPAKFYLFESVTDCQVTSFFRDRELKIYVLKAHFERYFRLFLEELAEFYEIIYGEKSVSKVL